MKLLAHITCKNGIRIEQNLHSHCVQTAQYASDSLKNLGLHNMAYLAGLLHDMGKATQKYNDYLEAAYSGEEAVRGSVNHTFAGVIYIWEKYHDSSFPIMERLTAEVISYAIGAHHGLFDCVDLEGKNGFMHRLNKDKKELCYEEAKNNYFGQVTTEEEVALLFNKALKEFEIIYQRICVDFEKNKNKVLFHIGLLSRLLLSAVIYGDRRDTGEFMSGNTDINQKSVDWAEERRYFENKLSQFDISSDLNRIRNIISEQCLKFSERPFGIYRLNVPTGGGKTLSTLRYAFAHAEKYNKKRIIFIIPLLSVLDQNAKVIKEYTKNNDIILEHHSNVICEKDCEDGREELDIYENLTETWESPIVVSTLVQFLNILFTHTTSAVGRMRALCDSVIIIDEIQSLPKKTIAMFNMAINFLNKYCNTTIVLSSATQPCLEELDWPVKFSTDPDMVSLNKEQLKVFERSEIIDSTTKYGMDMEECINFCRASMEENESLLVICNTKGEAKELFAGMAKIAEQEGWYICHLSTSMCQSHRMNILENLQNKLDLLQKNMKNNTPLQKVICISTQLVEAGIDFSFECVIRVLAGIDNLAQAAGRCNRSNEYGHKGKVYLIKLKNENLSMLKEISDAQNSTLNVLCSKEYLKNETLIGEYATRMFYRNLFREKEVKRQVKYPIKEYGNELFLTNLLSGENPYANKDIYSILHQPFKTAGKAFKVFDKQTVDVLVPYEEGKELIEKLKERDGTDFYPLSLKEIMQQAKKYTINIYQWQKEKLWEEGLLLDLFGGRLFVLDSLAYDGQYGLNTNAEHTIEDFIL